MKPEKVVFLEEDLEKSFNELKEEEPIKRGLKKAIKDIQENAFCGRNVKKNLIPKRYSNLNNLWIYNLPSSWRLIYSIAPGEIEIIAVILDWMDHKDYKNLFGF